MADCETFWELGNDIIRRRTRMHVRSSHERFRATFGTDAVICAILWTRLDFEQMPNGYKPLHLLWALMFLKVYAAEPVLAALAGVHERTYRKWTWCFVDAISTLQYSVIVWNNRFNNALAFVVVGGSPGRSLL